MRLIRKRRRLTGAELSQLLSWSESKVSRLETAHIGLSMADAHLFAKQLELEGDELATFLALAEDANTTGWWSTYRGAITTQQRMMADVENNAARIRHYASVTLPSLMQSQQYARHLLRWSHDLGVGGDDVDTAVAIRARRQRLLASSRSPHYDVIIEESVVRRRVAPDDVMNAQMRLLAQLANLPHVQLRLLPLTDAKRVYPPSTHAFQLIEFRDTSEPPVVSVETLVDLRYLSDRRHVDSYTVLFGRAWRTSLPPAETLEWLRAHSGSG